MNKKVFSILFVLGGTLLNLIITLALIIGMMFAGTRLLPSGNSGSQNTVAATTTSENSDEISSTLDESENKETTTVSEETKKSVKESPELPEDPGSANGATFLVLIFSILAGLVFGNIIYRKLMNKIMVRFNLEEKMETNWTGNVRKDANGKVLPRRKTNMPASVSLTEEEKEERERWGDK